MMKKMRKLKIILCLLVLTFIISSCGDKKVVNVATKPMTEQFILGSMFKMLVEENTDITVNLTEGVGGGTLNIHPAMLTGDFDIYPEYTGTAWNAVLEKESSYSDENFQDLKSEYEKLGLSVQNTIGFNNTFGIGVSQEVAEKYNLKTFSDLAKVSDELVFGAEYDFFERADGYEMLNNVYGISFKKNVDLDIGLKYDALKQGEIDVVNIFTTDGRIEGSNAVVLEDDKNMYPSYLCTFIARQEVLDTYPELVPVFEKLENTITNEDMTMMNYLVEISGEDYETVAYNFLIENNLINSEN